MGLIRHRDNRKAVLTTVAEVLAALGENPGARAITGRSDQAVSNWRLRGRFPPRTFLQFSIVLRRKRLRAAPALWGMSAPNGGNDADD
jgi:hypothetical protein